MNSFIAHDLPGGDVAVTFSPLLAATGKSG